MARTADPQVLTQANVRALRYTRTDRLPQIVWDRTMVGLGVRLTAGGARSFVLRYRVHGRQRLATLGPVNVHSVDAARRWAREQLAQADRGVDFQAAAEQQRALGTVGALWRRYIDEHVRVHGAERTADNLESLYKVHLAEPFGKRLLTELATADLAKWHRTASEPRTVDVLSKSGRATRQCAIGGPYSANRALQALKAAINWQLKQGTLPAGFRNPCLGVTPNREKPRDVILRPAELPQLTKAIEAHPDQFARALIWLAIYTGARRGELLGLRWEHVDVTAAAVTFVDTKNGTDRTVPLDPDVVRKLKELPRIDDNPHVFPASRGSGQRSDIKDAWSEIRTAADLPHLHLHDIRRTVGSWLGAAGNTAPMIGELLGHKSDVTSRVYIKLGSLDVKRELVAAQAGLIKSALNPRRRKRRTDGTKADK